MNPIASVSDLAAFAQLHCSYAIFYELGFELSKLALVEDLLSKELQFEQIFLSHSANVVYPASEYI